MLAAFLPGLTSIAAIALVSAALAIQSRRRVGKAAFFAAVLYEARLQGLDVGAVSRVAWHQASGPTP